MTVFLVAPRHSCCDPEVCSVWQHKSSPTITPVLCLAMVLRVQKLWYWQTVTEQLLSAPSGAWLGPPGWEDKAAPGVGTATALAEGTRSDSGSMKPRGWQNHYRVAIHLCKEFARLLIAQELLATLLPGSPALLHQRLPQWQISKLYRAGVMLRGSLWPIPSHTPDAKRTCHNYAGKFSRGTHSLGLL